APGDDAERGVGQLAVFGHALRFAVVTEHPDAAGVVITINVRPLQFRIPLAVVDEPAGEGAELGVIVLDDRGQDRRRPGLAFRAERVCPFLHAPAVVAALLDAVDHLPQVLPDFARPQIAGRGVEADLPALADAVGVNLRPRFLA